MFVGQLVESWVTFMMPFLWQKDFPVNMAIFSLTLTCFFGCGKKIKTYFALLWRLVNMATPCYHFEKNSIFHKNHIFSIGAINHECVFHWGLNHNFSIGVLPKNWTQFKFLNMCPFSLLLRLYLEAATEKCSLKYAFLNMCSWVYSIGA